MSKLPPAVNQSPPDQTPPDGGGRYNNIYNIPSSVPPVATTTQTSLCTARKKQPAHAGVFLSDLTPGSPSSVCNRVDGRAMADDCRGLKQLDQKQLGVKQFRDLVVYGVLSGTLAENWVSERQTD